MKELVLQNTRLDGRYDVLRLLGRGSYAEIFLARDNQAAADSLHKLVVIKALNVYLQDAPDADLERTLIENFQNEAYALDKVRHPNVINRLGHGTARDLRGTIFHYLVLEYLPGGNLSELCRTTTLSFEQTLFYFEQVCTGLQHAHEQGVIHRDIKPQNLLLTQNREVVKIADFGVARFADLDSPITRVGTNVYAAPEHSPANSSLPDFLGVQKLTPAADVYSLAKTIYSVIFGESPRRFANQPVTELPEKFRNQPWANSVLRVLKKATQANPSDRFQSVHEFWREFAEIKTNLKDTFEHSTKLDTANLADFVPQAPATPSFSSLKAVQKAVAEENSNPILPKPKIVVELNRTEQNRPAEKTRFQQEPISAEPRRENSDFVSIFNANQNDLPINGNGVKLQEVSEQAVENHSRKPAGFFKKLAVSVLLLAVFSGVLYGTFLYLRNGGNFPSGFNIFKTQLGTANKDAWLRSSPNVGNNQLGIVTVGSEMKIFNRSSDGSWFEVEIVEHGQPEKSNLSTMRGWIHRSIVDLQ
ncbi:MAG: serine/threonine protein kinase [Acidobacteriota bacterium]|nr:serine/threonine protein kinase [Acidobacteriota bacterium]